MFKKIPESYQKFSETVGMIMVNNQDFQLCDHVQDIGGQYYATVFTDKNHEDGYDPDSGIYYKKVSSARLAFITVDMLEAAISVYDDHEQTLKMKTRIIDALYDLNAKNLKVAA